LIYLIGINHELQQDSKPSFKQLRFWFLEYLESKIDQYNVQVIAEEMSEEALRGATPILKQLAEKKCIAHIFCDPNTAERKARNLRFSGRYATSEERAADFIKREQFWLERIRPYRDQEIIFVCGAYHYEGFKLMLEKDGFFVPEERNHQWDYDELLRRCYFEKENGIFLKVTD